ncbi:MAG TPA: HAD-IIIA family hydrolase [Chitinophagales bacterium]|nr:HAD-IIIA family hydrolase [Chitinophagales bacterium]
MEIQIDSSYTLFLDRDGVINKKINGGYVLSLDDLEFLPGVLDVMPKLSKLFPRIVVVTNQQCVGKGLLSVGDLNEIHLHMMNIIELNGGRIDAIYYAPDLKSSDNLLRKPNNGMALLAKNDFPEIDFTKSIMVGDNLTDMEFGKSLDMITFYISSSYKQNKLVDCAIAGLQDLINYLKS